MLLVPQDWIKLLVYVMVTSLMHTQVLKSLLLIHETTMYEQYVTCTTRLDKTIELCFGNIVDIYTQVLTSLLLTHQTRMLFIAPQICPETEKMKSKKETCERVVR